MTAQTLSNVESECLWQHPVECLLVKHLFEKQSDGIESDSILYVSSTSSGGSDGGLKINYDCYEFIMYSILTTINLSHKPNLYIKKSVHTLQVWKFVN